MKKLLLITILVFPFLLSAQTEIRKSSLAPVGGTVSSGNLAMIHAGGELANRETGSGTLHLSEGFIGPDLAAIMDVEDYTRLEGVRIYPNPVRDFLRIGLPDDGAYEIHLYALNGKEIYRTQTNGNAYKMDMRRLEPGMYLLVVIDRENHSYTSYKIQKQ
ncbi:MAG: T9SS type A sorting domain-containing protein [Chlorobi bacterium]|nr:T9SS type A sorting domain-containing protein [Chlorobiota bacterium]